jgi:tetrahydromethanopterin S-methyltransferase subunit D
MKLSLKDPSLPAILLWGSFGGICSAIVYYLLQEIWDRFLPNATGFFPYHDAQVIVLCTLLFAIHGYIARDLFYTGKDTQVSITGLVSGIGTALVFTAIIAFQMTMSDAMDLSDLPVLFAEILLGSVALQVAGAWVHQFKYPAPPDELNTQSASAVAKRLCNHRLLFLAVLAVLVIPPGLLYLSMSTGVVAEELSCCAPIITDSVDVTRTGPDSIRIIMLPDLRAKHASVPTVTILLNEKDVSNQSIISGSRLDDTIDPPTGLPFKRKASVTLHGSDVSGNETVPVHLQIIVTYPDLGLRVMICDQEI